MMCAFNLKLKNSTFHLKKYFRNCWHSRIQGLLIFEFGQRCILITSSYWKTVHRRSKLCVCINKYTYILLQMLEIHLGTTDKTVLEEIMSLVFTTLPEIIMSSGAKILQICINLSSLGSGPRGENGLHELWSIKDMILCFQISGPNPFSTTSIQFPSFCPSCCESGDNLQAKRY